MDQATMHTDEIVIKDFESKDTEIQFIPKGMTIVIQPLDVSVISLLKFILRIDILNIIMKKILLKK